MACKAGMSQTMVSRVWRAFGLQPHRSETFLFAALDVKTNKMIGTCKGCRRSTEFRTPSSAGSRC